MITLKNKIKHLIGDDTIYIIKDIKNKVIPSHLYKKELEEDAVRKVFYSKFILKGDIFFDVGANVGNRVLPLLELGAKVFAFEPQKSCRNILKWRFGGKITVIPKALGENEDEKNLHVSNFSGISSISTDWINSVKDTRFKNYEWGAVEKVQITTLDKAIKTYGVPKFIKIDVEGYELEVLKGLSQPIDIISFEYTTPEQTDKAIACIKRISLLDKNIECNYSIGESMKFSLTKWVKVEEMLSIVNSKSFIDTNFGDIYLRKNSYNF